MHAMGSDHNELKSPPTIALGKPARSFHIQIHLIKLIRLFANLHVANALFYIIRFPINTEKHNSTSFYIENNCSKPSLSRINHPTEASPCQFQQALLSRQSRGSGIFTMQVRLHCFEIFLQYSLNKLQSHFPKINPVAISVFKHQATYHEDILSPFLCLSISRCSTKERYPTSPSPSTSWLSSPSSPFQIPLNHHLLICQLRIPIL